MRVYVSGPLQGAPDLAAAREFYERIARVLRDAGHSPYLPHLQTDPELAAHVTAAAVYRRDVDALLRCGAVVAHLGAPSSGVGAELAIAAHARLPVVGLRREGEKVSRFAEGLLLDAGGVLLTFRDERELRDLLPGALPAPRRVAQPASAASRVLSAVTTAAFGRRRAA